MDESDCICNAGYTCTVRQVETHVCRVQKVHTNQPLEIFHVWFAVLVEGYPRPLVQKAMRVLYCLTRVSTENYNAGARLVDLVPPKAEIPVWRVLYLKRRR